MSRRALSLWLVAVSLLAGACSSDFETPSIVLDLRMLAAKTEPAEVMVPVDANPQDLEVPDIEVCALVADPGASRSLSFEMAACAPTSSLRCDELDEPILQFDSGMIDDPEESPTPVAMCGTLQGSPLLIDVVRQAVENDPLLGFSSIAVQIEIFVKPSGGADSDGIYGAKRAFFAVQIPEERVANNNPSVDQLLLAREQDPEPTDPVTLLRCSDADADPIIAAPGEQLMFLPVEPDGVREDYVLPTIDGGSRMFTENMSYAWFATAGEWSRETTGGPKDVVGNIPPLDTTWAAPEELDAPLDVDMWLVQRDERGGQAWYEMCVRVDPDA